MSDKNTPDHPEALVIETASPFSPHRAFVVQFRAETAVARWHVAGRIEHIVSGLATHFHSLEELLVFVERVLADVPENPP